MKATIVDIDLRILGRILGLSEDVVIDRVVEHLNQPGVVSFRFVGEGLPDRFTVADGYMVPKSSLYGQSKDGVTRINWWCLQGESACEVDNTAIQQKERADKLEERVRELERRLPRPPTYEMSNEHGSLDDE